MIKKYKNLIVIILAVFIPVGFSNAGLIEISIRTSSYDLHEVFSVDVHMNTENESINAIEGSVYFDKEYLKVVDVVDGDSVVNFWVEKSTEEDHVVFSGIVPGGYKGEKGKVISVVFQTISSGETSINLNNGALFVNDGLGTKKDIKNSVADITISKTESQNSKINTDYSYDINPPESFKAEISHSPSLFDDKWFLVFSTKDKGSGVSHYLIKEARYRPLMFFKRWSLAESPYILKDQTKSSFIAIKAFDKAGNQVTEKIYPENKRSIIEQISFGLLFIFAILFFIFILYIAFKKISKIDEY